MTTDRKPTEQGETMTEHLSDDGRYWWDGTTWQAREIPEPAPPPKRSYLNAALIGVLILLGLLILGAVAAKPTAVSAPPVTTAPAVPALLTTTTTAAPTTTAPASKREQFFEGLESHSLAAYANTAAVDLVTTICQTITDVGVNAAMREVVAGAVRNDLDTGDVGKLLAIGVPIYCPQHSAVLKAWGAKQ